MLEKTAKRRASHLVLFINYYYGNKTKRMRWVGHAACTREMRNAYKILDGKS
jgi:hypothetical protein